MRPHILLNGRTVHQEIPEGDTEDEIALAAKMKEAPRDIPTSRFTKSNYNWIKDHPVKTVRNRKLTPSQRP